MSKKSMSLDEVKAEIGRLMAIQRKMEKDEFKQKVLPKMRRMIGKTFKFQNSYSSGKNWWLWIKVVGIKEQCLRIVQSERDCYGKIEVLAGVVIFPLNDRYIEVDAKEYAAAVSEIMAEVNSLIGTES